jgi:hypothetical protein
MVFGNITSNVKAFIGTTLRLMGWIQRFFLHGLIFSKQRAPATTEGRQEDKQRMMSHWNLLDEVL